MVGYNCFISFRYYYNVSKYFFFWNFMKTEIFKTFWKFYHFEICWKFWNLMNYLNFSFEILEILNIFENFEILWNFMKFVLKICWNFGKYIVYSTDVSKNTLINRHIARHDVILNDLFSGGWNSGNILKFTSQAFSTSVAMTSHKQTESGREVLQTQAECKYKFVHIELVI